MIHTDTEGEITKRDLDKAREAARDIDKADNKIKAIVSVMMLREGWDVRNVTVVLGLRPFTAKAEILPEQVIGRGLRLMTAGEPGPHADPGGARHPQPAQRAAHQLEAEGVGVATHEDRSAAAGHHRAGAGATGLRHRHSRSPSRASSTTSASSPNSRSRRSSAIYEQEDWPSVSGQAEARVRDHRDGGPPGRHRRGRASAAAGAARLASPTR